MKLKTETGHQSPVSGLRMKPVIITGLWSENETGRQFPVFGLKMKPVVGLPSVF